MICLVGLQILNKILKSKDPSIIINNDLTESHFISCEHYYNFIMNHYRRWGNVPDMTTFLDEFEDFQPMDVAESDEFLVDKIQEEFLYAKLVPVLQQSANLIQSNSVDAFEFLKASLNTLTPKTGSYGVDIIAQAEERYEEYVNKQNAETPWMMPTGFKELDDVVGGFSKGEEFVVIVARTNQGKSWILGKIATHNWKVGFNVGYISPEMSANAIGYRFDSLNEHFSNTDLFRGIEITSYADYIQDLKKNAKHRFQVATPMDFNKRITVSKLRAFCLQCNLDMLCIDGITYLSDERYKKGDNKTTSLTNISEDLMELSVELKIPIIVVVQANRSGAGLEEGVPELESIRDSDGISHNASKVISLRQTNGKLMMEVKKNRNGPVNVKLVYDWNIDIGEFKYNSSPNEFHVSESSQSKYTNNAPKDTPVNKQPLRRAANTGAVVF